MEIKKLAALLERIENAKRCTPSLLEKTQAFAQFIESQMIDLGVNQLMQGKYQLRTLHASVGTDTSLYMRTNEDSGYDWCYVYLGVKSIDAKRDTFYLWGDFSAPYNKPNRNDIFEFIGDAEALLGELASFGKVPDVGHLPTV